VKIIADLMLAMTAYICAFIGVRTSKNKIDSAFWYCVAIFEVVGIFIFYSKNF
jgi:hypothetical protein